MIQKKKKSICLIIKKNKNLLIWLKLSGRKRMLNLKKWMLLLMAIEKKLETKIWKTLIKWSMDLLKKLRNLIQLLNKVLVLMFLKLKKMLLSMNKCLRLMMETKKKFIRCKELSIDWRKILLFSLWKFNKIRENVMKEMNILKKKKIK